MLGKHISVKKGGKLYVRSTWRPLQVSGACQGLGVLLLLYLGRFNMHFLYLRDPTELGRPADFYSFTVNSCHILLLLLTLFKYIRML